MFAPPTKPVDSIQPIEKTVFSTLQAGRAFAVVAVVAFHAHVFFIPERLYPGQNVSRVFDMGYAGVEFFFVLSGFIMLLVHRGDIGVPGMARRFAERRINRIIPFYWVVTAAMIALLAVQLPETASELRLGRVLHSLFLIPMPDGEKLLIGAAWTLTHEFLFYGFFALLILSPRLGGAAFALWLGLAALGLPLSYPADTLLSPYNLLFPMGMLAAAAFVRVPPAAAAGLALLGVVAFVTVGLLDAYRVTDIGHTARTLSFGIAATAAVIGLAALEWRGRLRAPRWLSFLGDASYAIYLVHIVALPVITRLMMAAGLNTLLPPFAGYAVLVASAVAAGSLAHVTVERPLGRAIRNRRTRRQQRRAGVATADHAG